MMSKNILLAVTGSIAAYKSCELVRLLKKQGHNVTVAMSQAATEFVSAQTFQALSGQPVLTSQNQSSNSMAHIHATRTADIMLIAPASANTIAKIAQGIADNLITEMVAARNCPLVIAPAMNVQMWHNPANQRNIQQLQQDGVHILQPASGEQACGETGIGRMLEANEIVELLPDFWSEKILADKKVLISAGATFEAIDPVRGITNLSSGKMGIALAQACRRVGAEVFLVYGKLQTPLPLGLSHYQEACSAKEMLHTIQTIISTGIDIFISVAAVADYHVRTPASQKIKKDHLQSPPIIELAENPDILKEIASLPSPPFCVGFAAETENVLEHARQKRQKKNIPLLVANDVSVAMGQQHNQIILIDEQQETALPLMSKEQTAQAIIQRIAQLINPS